MSKTMSRFRRRPVLYSAATAVLLSSCAVPSAVAAVSGGDSMRIEPPAPTGPYDVGRVDLHLADDQRNDVWADEDARELMASVWYPAEHDADGEPAPYVSEAVAQKLDGDLQQADLSPGAVDWAGTNTHATTIADVAEKAGDLPVVVYSPGFAANRYLAAAQAEELASQGYAVVTMDHTYETSVVEFPDGRVKEQYQPESGQWGVAAFKKAVSVRVADSRFLLDSLDEITDGRNPDAEKRVLPEGLAGALDLSSVGMYGHSMGGFTAAETMLVDERIDAGGNLDGSIAYHVGDEEWGDSTTRGVDRPFLLVGGGLTGTADVPHNSGHTPDWQMFRAASGGNVLELYLPEAEHHSFVDQQWLVPRVDAEYGLEDPVGKQLLASIGGIDPEASVAAQRAYLTAFFDEKLRGQDQPLLDGPSPEYPQVEFID